MILPAPDNPRLAEILGRIEADATLPKLWELSITNSARAGVNDHGPTHVKIVAHNALKILRLLLAAGVEPNMVKDHQMTRADAEIVVALAGLLHDVGMSTHRDGHEAHSLFIVNAALPRLLEGLYEPAARTTMLSETLHAMIGHNHAQRCLTIEAGVVKVADALDMSKWRSRYIIKQGRVSIHSLSAAAIDRVSVGAGKTRPVAVEITMNNSAGIFQVDTLLKDKVAGSGIAEYLEVTTRVVGDAERQHIQHYKL
ncbi:MAG: HD domain-containing protein [Candidatus Sericytochromatia bacterium]|nr:HD domain-containing protein [Candidatus Tanganyikabacteria bacterium]